MDLNLSTDNSGTKMSLFENKTDFLGKIVLVPGKDHTIFRNNITSDLRNDRNML